MYLVFDIGGEKARVRHAGGMSQDFVRPFRRKVHKVDRLCKRAFARPYELVLCEATKIAIRCTAPVGGK